MMIPLDILVVAVAGFAAYLVYVIAKPALQSFNAFQSPRAVAFVVSMLTLLAIVALGRAIILLLLIPYAVLGVVLVGMYLTRFFAVRSTGPIPPTLKPYCQSVRRAGRACAKRIQEESDKHWSK
jgi:hypothetical protein